MIFGDEFRLVQNIVGGYEYLLNKILLLSNCYFTYVIRDVDFQEQLRKGLINQHIGLIRESVENGAKIKFVEEEKGLSWVFKELDFNKIRFFSVIRANNADTLQ